MASNTAWVLSAALQGLTQAAGPGGKEFLPAARFAGAKPGYVFNVGEHGLGYYLDPHQADAHAEGGVDGSGAGGSGEGRAAAAQQQQLDPEELLRQAEEDANIDQIQTLDAKSLRRLVAGLDKKYKENLGLRLKYADQPDKFLDSEVDLDEHIKSLMQVAGSPELYPLLLDGPCLPTLLALLGHENTDIAADTVELMAEMTGADAAEEFGEEARSLVDCLVEHNAPELVVQRLLGFKEDVDEEARAVQNCLAVVENLVEIQPDLATVFVDKTKLLTWLLRRLKRRDFDANKQYASEVLAVLMQGSVSNQTRLGTENGIDLLLTCVAQYKSKDPSPGEEEEYMQNCFDVLCACLMQPAHKAAFVKAEGVELMHLMLQSRRQCRYGAIKCLDYAATRYGPPAEKLVDLGGLKQLFGFFMGKAKVKGPLGEHDVETEVEQRCVSLVASLLLQLPASGRGAARRERLLAKFVEAEFEKTDRLMELLFRYQTRVRAEERRLMSALAEADEGEQVDEDELLMARMDAGLFTLQQCCVVFGNLWATGDVGLRRRLLALLHQKGQTLAPVREVLLEYYNNIGTEAGPEEAARSRAHVRGLLEAMGAQLEEEAEGEQQQARAAPGGPPREEGDAMELDEGASAGQGRAPPPLPPNEAPSGSGRAATDSRRKADSALMPPPPPPPPPPPASAAAAKPARARAPSEEGEDDGGAGPRGHVDRDARADRDRPSRDGGRDGKDKERKDSKEKERSKEKDKDKERERERERDRDRDKDRDRREYSRRDREAELAEGEEERRKAPPSGRDRDSSGGKEREKEREKGREREKERDREPRREKERERDRDRR